MSPIIPYLLATLCGIVLYGLLDRPIPYVCGTTFACLGIGLISLLIIRHKAPLISKRWVTVPMLLLTILFAYNQTSLNESRPYSVSEETEISDFTASIRTSADYCTETLSSLCIQERNLGLIQAILLGDKTGLSPDQRNAFRRTGTMHILVVSGMHVALVFMVFRFLFAFLGLGNNRATNVVIVIIIWLYAALTGLAPSVCRASLMLSFASLLPLFWSRIDSHDAIYLSLIVLLLHNPSLISSYSLWLSYISVYAISQSTWLLVKIDGWLTNNKNLLWRITSRFAKWVAQLLLVSFVCQLATAPIILSFNDSFPTFFGVNNVVIVPLLTPLLILSTFSIILAPLSVSIAQWLAKGADLLLSTMDNYTQYAQHWHQTDVQLSGYTTSDIIILSIIMVLFFTLIGQWRNNNRTLCGSVLCLACLSFFASNLISPYTHKGDRQYTEIWRRYSNTNVSIISNRSIIHLLSDTTDDASLNYCVRLNHKYHALSSTISPLSSTITISTPSDTLTVTPQGIIHHNNEIILLHSSNSREISFQME